MIPLQHSFGIQIFENRSPQNLKQKQSQLMKWKTPFCPL
ncbi:hypothetical protein DOT_5859 [Desulfosporosinus sp. OT]|nr:hypothetical protein DOT_5859 [Desulfosporosinus sp. OT]